MQTSFVRRLLIVTVPLVLMAVLLALTLARLFYSKANPYTQYLRMTPVEVHQFATCYNGGYLSYIREYCLHTDDAESINFSIGSEGQVLTVGVFRQAAAVQVGDLWAWYGAPDRVNAQRQWAAYYWNGEMRILATARGSSPYARVTFVHFTLQTDSQSALP